MRRTALAVAALLAAASPALAAGAYITRTVQDGSGTHLQSYYDESGTGAGPFDPVFQVPSGTNLGGQSGGGTAADQTGTNATDGQATSTNNQHTLAFGYGWSGSAWDRLYVDATTHGVLERTVGPSMNAPGTSGTIARSIQGVTGGVPVPVGQSGAPWSTTDTNAVNTITAPGTAAAKSQSVQGADGTALAKDASVQAVKTALGSPFQAGASIANTAFGISGQLPAFATTPTFNIGTAPTITVQGTLSTFGYAVATAALPTGYTAGQNNPLSQDLSGHLRTLSTTDQTTHGTTDKVAADLYVGGAANASGNPAYVAGTINQGSAGPAWQFYQSASIYAGGIQTFSRIPVSANSTNLTNAKTSVGRVFKITGFNTYSAVLRIKFYNAASTGAVTVGTTPVYFSKALPPGPFSYDEADLGWSFSTGITYAMTVNPADSDATAIPAGAITDLSVEIQ